MNQTTTEPENGPSNRTSDAARPAVRIAAVAGIFSLIVAALLLYDYSRRQAKDPFESPSYKILKLALKQDPTNEELRVEIRELDLQLRREYFRQRKFTAVGAWLLLGGAVVFLIAAISANTMRRKLPEPGPQSSPVDREAGWTRIARWSVGALAAVLVGTALALSFTLRIEVPKDFKELVGTPPIGTPDNGTPKNGPAKVEPKSLLAPYPPPSDEEIRNNWPRFRGPGGLAVSAYTNVPEKFDGASGENVIWKTPVPLKGKNSPVLWGDRIFLTGATEKERQVFCFDAADGKLLWKKDVPGTPQSTLKPPEVDKTHTGFAAPTAVTDGQRVFAIFANGDMAAFDFEGNLAWSRSFGIPDNVYGHASSLAMYKSLVLVQIDHGSARAKKSRLYAVNACDGKTAWETVREMPCSWMTPIVISHQGRDQVITGSDPWLISQNPSDGTELWRAEILSGECGPSPVYAGGLLQTGNEYCVWSAVKPDGTGNVTETHVAWTGEDGLPDMVSPLATEELVFLMPSSSYFTCYDATNGEMLWEKEYEDDYFTSSPSLVGERVYLFSNEGKAFIFHPNREEYKEIAQASLGEKCVTSPAFGDGRFYIRGEKHLFCIGKP